MTDAPTFNPSPRPFAAEEDLTLPIVVYVLYLLAIPTACISPVVGVVIAYANRDTCGPAARSHYEFAIRTFWLSLMGLAVGVVGCVIGGILSLVLVGIPLLLASILLLVAGKIWYVVRCILGIMHAARHDAYPRPEAVLA